MFWQSGIRLPRLSNQGNYTVNYLDRMLQPVTEAMSVEFAQKLVELRADNELLSRIEVPRRKANDGSLTAEEESEYRDYVESLDLISILHAKTRRVLTDRAS